LSSYFSFSFALFFSPANELPHISHFPFAILTQTLQTESVRYVVTHSQGKRKEQMKKKANLTSMVIGLIDLMQELIGMLVEQQKIIRLILIHMNLLMSQNLMKTENQ
jgi:hypothetical protein